MTLSGSFYYLSGADHPDCFVTYDLVDDKLILWVPYVEPRQVLWYGRTPSPEEYLSRSEVDSVRYTRDLPSFLHAYFHHNHGQSALFLLDESQAPPRLRANYLSRYDIAVDTEALRPAMDEARVIKTPHEIALIRRANAISSAAHRAVQRRIASMTNEREVQALFESQCALRGAKRQAYALIAGAGENAATLHYDANDQPLEGKQFLVLDAGCEFECYASDVTRTLALPGREGLTPESRAVRRLVEKMQRECVAGVAPGRLYFALHLHASRVALAGLRALGVLKGDPTDIWRAGTVAAFFPHGLGHHVGLETHDVSGNTRLLLSEAEAAMQGPRRTKRELFSAEAFVGVPWEAVVSGEAMRLYGDEKARHGEQATSTARVPPPPYKGRQALKPGMVVTVEPGIYFCREYIEGYFLKSEKHRDFIDADVLERYYHVGGVRIEDDILVTAKGHENLTSVPKRREVDGLVDSKE